MSTTATPEEQELAEKRFQLAELETALADRELYLATLQADLQRFEALYLHTVGSRYAELDDLTARIAEFLATRYPDHQAYREQAVHSRTRARESAGAAAATAVPTEAFKPSSELKMLYRQLAKRIHPDLATADDDRARREQLMKQVNEAYAAGDEARLRALLQEWDASPEAVTGEGAGAELVRTIRKIHQIRRRLANIETEVQELRATDLFKLKAKADVAAQQGRDLLKEMAAATDRQIAEARNRLASLVGL